MLEDKKKKEIEELANGLPDDRLIEAIREAETICTRKELGKLEEEMQSLARALTDRVTLSEVVKLIVKVEELERRQIAAMLRGYADAETHEQVAVRVLLNASVVEKKQNKNQP